MPEVMNTTEISIDDLHTLHQAIYTAKHYVPERNTTATKMIEDADALIKEKSRTINHDIDKGHLNEKS